MDVWPRLARPPDRFRRLARADCARRASLYAGRSAPWPVVSGLSCSAGRRYNAASESFSGDRRGDLRRGFHESGTHPCKSRSRRSRPRAIADPVARGLSPMTARPTIACLGAGRMGRGIAVAFAYAGHAVIMIDVKARTADQFATLEAEALGEVKKTMASLARFGLLAEKDADAVVARISVMSAQNMAAALAGAGIVFEGLPEVVDLKREVLAAASQCVGPEVIVASTTSTILVDDLSGAVEHRGRFLNVHWLNPA